MTILHTWSQTLIDHFHIHCLIPAGVLSPDERRWVPGNEDYLFRVQSLAKEFKKQYLSMVKSRSEQLVLPEDSDNLIKQAWEKDWFVYAKKPFTGPEKVLKYLGRYTHRIAISNHRIKSMENGEVIFTYKDRQDEVKVKTLKLSAVEFIRRFLLHVLPFRFMKIRYYGFLALSYQPNIIVDTNSISLGSTPRRIVIRVTLFRVASLRSGTVYIYPAATHIAKCPAKRYIRCICTR